MSSLWKAKSLIPLSTAPQLDQLKAASDENHSKLVNRKCKIFRQDNSRLHVSLMIRKKLFELGWDILIHLLCSPDIAP